MAKRGTQFGTLENRRGSAKRNQKVAKKAYNSREGQKGGAINPAGPPPEGGQRCDLGGIIPWDVARGGEERKKSAYFATYHQEKLKELVRGLVGWPRRH